VQNHGLWGRDCVLDKERRRFLEKSINELCTGTDSRLANLKEKYRGDSVVIERLSLYEKDIEPNN